ncbi:tetratricopeptide repeat protein [Glaciimonas soli]|uniref:Tetratricopeptide repeat protein n=1 Tax=Glaciimonas soli TaxID=2590999 RepID=A0A843YYY2_9BURK|nr:tetratricopeptide repeat protein [Glaciimonas soli]MQR02412.1 tetratricopeptide repeat protein [Glaciimonas soli]
MSNMEAAWEKQIADLWLTIDDVNSEEFINRINNLASELPAGSAIGLFERAAAQDSTGHSDKAVPLYRAALEAGLTGLRRRRATIQMASSLRNLGNAAEAVSLLTAELHAADDELNGAVRAFLALALVDVGREREAVDISLIALTQYLPRYNRSLVRYAQLLTI